MKFNLNIPEKLQSQQMLIEQVAQLALERYGENDAAHGFDHALRVTRLALSMGQQEGADLELLVLAGLLHDVARREQAETGVCHATRGAELAGELLKQISYPEERIPLIQGMIQTHRFRAESGTPTTLEEKILYDADKLDAIGAIGIARAYAICGRRNQRLYMTEAEMVLNEDDQDYSPIVEYHFKLKKILDKMLTSSGRELAVRRHTFMEQFFTEIKQEVEGES